MKKKITFLLSLALTLIVSASMMAFAASAFAEEQATVTVDGSATDLQILDVRTETDGGTDKKVGVVINQNLCGSQDNNTMNFALESTKYSADKIEYKTADNGTRTLGGVTYKLFDDVIAGLVFSFEEDTATDGAVTYGEGDTLTFKKGFTVSGRESTPVTAKLAEDFTLTYTDGEWTGTFPDANLNNMSASWGPIGPANNGAAASVVVDFGISNPTGEFAHMDTANNGWAAMLTHLQKVVTHITNHAEYQYNGNLYLPGGCSMMVSAAGKYGVELGTTPLKGDYIRFKKGFVLYDIKNVGKVDPNQSAWAWFAGYAEDYRPVLVLHEDVTFQYDGSKWDRIVFASEGEFTNTDEEKALLAVNTTLQLKYTSNGTEPTPTFTSSDKSVATVSKKGVVTGKSEGTATITAKFKEIQFTVELTVAAEPAKTGITAAVKTGASQKNVKGMVVYKGDPAPTKEEVLAAVETFSYTYANGAKGISHKLTGDSAVDSSVSADEFSSAEAGQTKVVLTVGEYSCDIPVYVYETKVIDDIDTTCFTIWGETAPPIAISLGKCGVTGTGVTDVRNVEPENPSMVTMREPTHEQSEISYDCYAVGQLSDTIAMLYFSNVDYGAKTGLRIGMVLTFTEDFRFYFWQDSYWIAAYKFADKLEFVWTGEEWVEYTADATDVRVEKTSLTMPLLAEYDIEYTLLPENSYVIPTVTLDGESSAVEISGTKIIAKNIGTATVNVTVGENTRRISVTVEQAVPKGVALAGRKKYYVAKDAQFDYGKVNVKTDLGNGFYGEPFALTAEKITNSNLDTTKAGEQTVTLTVKHTELETEVTSDIEILVEVINSVAQIPDSFWSGDEPGNFMSPAIAIFFQKTYPNTVNITTDEKSMLTQAERDTVINYISYEREGVTVDCGKPSFLTFFLAFTPKINGVAITQYLVGDVITLHKGMCFYKWYGEIPVSGALTSEYGDFVKMGEIEYDVTFTYRNDGKFWMEIQYVEGVAVETSVKVGLGAQHIANVATVPSYATVGEWEYEVADKTVAEVNAHGVITGKKIGTTKVTATLSGGKAGDKVVEFTVEVTDTVTGIRINAPKGLRVDLGTDLTTSKLIEMGVTATKVWASGKAEGEVDITSARITGYDPEKSGEQELTLRVSVDGKSVTGKFTVTVGKTSKSGCGCGSTVASVSSIVLGACALIVAALLALRKRNQNA